MGCWTQSAILSQECVSASSGVMGRERRLPGREPWRGDQCIASFWQGVLFDPQCGFSSSLDSMSNFINCVILHENEFPVSLEKNQKVLSPGPTFSKWQHSMMSKCWPLRTGPGAPGCLSPRCLSFQRYFKLPGFMF